MKKVVSILLLVCSLMFAGCNMCGTPTSLMVLSPWGRLDILEVSTYKISAEKPNESDLKGFRIPYYVVGEGTYTSKLVKEENNIVIDNTLTFTGKYYTVEGEVILDKDGSGDGTFTDTFTARTIVNGLSAGTFESQKSEKNVGRATLVAADNTAETAKYFLLAGSFKQSIRYDAEIATATLEHFELANYTGDNAFKPDFGKNDDGTPILTRDYKYKEKDLIYDSESFASAMRAYSLNEKFAGGSTTPNSFRAVDPMSDTANLKEFSFSAKEEKATVAFKECLAPANLEDVDADENVYAEKDGVEYDAYTVTLTLKGSYSGTAKTYTILKDDKVSYINEDHVIADPTSYNRVVKMTDGMNMVYTLTSYFNGSSKG